MNSMLTLGVLAEFLLPLGWRSRSPGDGQLSAMATHTIQSTHTLFLHLASLFNDLQILQDSTAAAAAPGPALQQRLANLAQPLVHVTPARTLTAVPLPKRLIAVATRVALALVKYDLRVGSDLILASTPEATQVVIRNAAVRTLARHATRAMILKHIVDNGVSPIQYGPVAAAMNTKKARIALRDTADFALLQAATLKRIAALRATVCATQAPKALAMEAKLLLDFISRAREPVTLSSRANGVRLEHYTRAQALKLPILSNSNALPFQSAQAKARTVQIRVNLSNLRVRKPNRVIRNDQRTAPRFIPHMRCFLEYTEASKKEITRDTLARFRALNAMKRRRTRAPRRVVAPGGAARAPAAPQLVDNVPPARDNWLEAALRPVARATQVQSLRIGTLNVQSLNVDKLEKARVEMETSSLDVLVLPETWCTAEVTAELPPSFLNPLAGATFLNARGLQTEKANNDNTAYGGVGVLAREGYVPRVLRSTSTPEVYALWLAYGDLASHCTVVGALYLPPTPNAAMLASCMRTLQTELDAVRRLVRPNTPIILAGDLNFHTGGSLPRDIKLQTWLENNAFVDAHLGFEGDRHTYQHAASRTIVDYIFAPAESQIVSALAPATIPDLAHRLVAGEVVVDHSMPPTDASAPVAWNRLRAENPMKIQSSEHVARGDVAIKDGRRWVSSSATKVITTAMELLEDAQLWNTHRHLLASAAEQHAQRAALLAGLNPNEAAEAGAAARAKSNGSTAGPHCPHLVSLVVAEAGRRVLGTKRPGAPRKPGWDQDVRTAYKKTQAAAITYRECARAAGVPIDRLPAEHPARKLVEAAQDKLKQCEREFSHIRSTRMREAWERLLLDASENAGSSTMFYLAQVLSGSRARAAASSHIPVPEAELVDFWRTLALDNERDATDSAIFLKASRTAFDKSDTMSIDELHAAVVRQSPHKAPGNDGIPNAVWQTLLLSMPSQEDPESDDLPEADVPAGNGDRLTELETQRMRLSKKLLEAYNSVFTGKTSPLPEWVASNVRLIFKKKGSASDPANYRPIALLNCSLKIFETMILTRVNEHIDAPNNRKLRDRVISATQAGFRAGRSTQEQVAVMDTIGAWGRTTGRPVISVLIDVAKAFDSVPFSRVLRAMQQWEVSSNIQRAFHTLYSVERKARLILGKNRYSAAYEVQRGVPQGSILSPLAFIAAFDCVLRVANENSDLPALLGRSMLAAVGSLPFQISVHEASPPDLRTELAGMTIKQTKEINAALLFSEKECREAAPFGAIAFADDLTLNAVSIEAANRMIAEAQRVASAELRIKFHPSKSVCLISGDIRTLDNNFHKLHTHSKLKEGDLPKPGIFCGNNEIPLGLIDGQHAVELLGVQLNAHPNLVTGTRLDKGISAKKTLATLTRARRLLTPFAARTLARGWLIPKFTYGLGLFTYSKETQERLNRVSAQAARLALRLPPNSPSVLALKDAGVASTSYIADQEALRIAFGLATHPEKCYTQLYEYGIKAYTSHTTRTITSTNIHPGVFRTGKVHTSGIDKTHFPWYGRITELLAAAPALPKIARDEAMVTQQRKISEVAGQLEELRKESERAQATGSPASHLTNLAVNIEVKSFELQTERNKLRELNPRLPSALAQLGTLEQCMGALLQEFTDSIDKLTHMEMLSSLEFKPVEATRALRAGLAGVWRRITAATHLHREANTTAATSTCSFTKTSPALLLRDIAYHVERRIPPAINDALLRNYGLGSTTEHRLDPGVLILRPRPYVSALGTSAQDVTRMRFGVAPLALSACPGCSLNRGYTLGHALACAHTLSRETLELLTEARESLMQFLNAWATNCALQLTRKFRSRDLTNSTQPEVWGTMDSRLLMALVVADLPIYNRPTRNATRLARNQAAGQTASLLTLALRRAFKELTSKAREAYNARRPVRAVAPALAPVPAGPVQARIQDYFRPL